MPKASVAISYPIAGIPIGENFVAYGTIDLEKVAVQVSLTPLNGGSAVYPVTTFHRKRALVRGGTQATGTATVAGNQVTAATVTAAGSGYVAVPRVFVRGGGGRGAKISAVLGTPGTASAGTITAFNVDKPGSGYATAPTLVIEPPKFGRWTAVFRNVPLGNHVLAARPTDGGPLVPRPIQVLAGITTATRVVSGPPRGYSAFPDPNTDFVPSNFYAYGLLDLGDNFIVSATMQQTDASGVPQDDVQPASFIFTDQDSGFWVAEFDVISDTAGTPAANNSLFTFQAQGDQTAENNANYQITGLNAKN